MPKNYILKIFQKYHPCASVRHAVTSSRCIAMHARGGLKLRVAPSMAEALKRFEAVSSAELKLKAR